MNNPGLALVLGGGGAAGQAWLIGVMAGLAEGGIDLAERADLVIGTSAGATAAAQVRSGTALSRLFEAILAEPSRPAGQAAPRGPMHDAPIPIETVFTRMRALGEAATSAEELQQGMGAFALESDALLGADAAQRRRAMVAARLPVPDWPERAMIVTAVDAQSGALVAFDREGKASLLDAVNASTAAPALVPSVEIAGRRYIDGGIRSVENADLAEDFGTVIVLSPFGGPRLAAPGQFEGLRREAAWRTTLESQVDYLRERGSRVEMIVPDEDARAAMGVNAMDFAARIPSARAGFAQGEREAARLTPL